MSIYYEAGNQELKGKLAVGQVILNRVKSDKYSNTVCGVVKEANQFSFYWDGKPEKIPSQRNKLERKAWEASYQLASFLLSEGSLGGHVADITGNSMHYHATYVNPSWATTQSVTIGDHVFYSGID